MKPRFNTDSMQSSGEAGSDIKTSTLLRFPTIPVDGTPAGWLSQSQLVNMTSHNEDNSCDEGSSSLGESTYDFIDDRSITDDDDQDGMAESTTSSSDGRCVDKLTDERELPLQIEHRSQGSDEQNFHQSVSPDSSSGIRDETAFSQSQAVGSITNPAFSKHSAGTIKFEERSVTNLDSARFVEVSHNLRQIKENEISSSIACAGQIRVTLRQTMTSLSLDLKGKGYKVLYVGDPAVKDIIMQKLGAALAANLKDTPRASKFNVFPMSYEDSTNSEVLLMGSSGIELIVEECNRASFVRRQEDRDTISMELSDGTNIQSWWGGSDFFVSDDWVLPDISIFCVSCDDDIFAMQTRRFARSLMSRHGIQSIIISKASLNLKSAEPITLDYFTPHVCLERQAPNEERPHIVRRLPIELETFLSIEAGQMNRNLSCLALAKRSACCKKDYVPQDQDVLFAKRSFSCTYVIDTCKSAIKTVPVFGLVLALLLVIVCLVPIFDFATPRISSNRITQMRATHSDPGQLISTSSNSVSSRGLTGTTASSTLSVSPQASQVKNLSTDTDIASFLLDAYALTPNKSQRFKIHVSGDCYVIMRPPHSFMELWRAPALLYNISRKGSSLKHTVSTLFDGVYALQVPREEAYGMVNITIWTESKPHIQERFELDFGSSWLKIAAWKRATHAVTKAVQSDINIVQNGLSIVYDQTKTELSVFVNNTKQKVAIQKEAEKAALVAHLQWAARMRNIMSAQGTELSRNFFHKMQSSIRHASWTIKDHLRISTNHIGVRTYSTNNMATEFAKLVTQTASGVDVQVLCKEIQDFRLKCLRAFQKRALKTWWRLGGTPKHPKQKAVRTKDRNGFRGRKSRR